jgi:hypothetical protein
MLLSLDVSKVREKQMSGEIVVNLSDEAVLIQSKSAPGQWHTVTMLDGEVASCTCASFAYRGRCRHGRIALGSLRAPCDVCGRPTTNRCGGRIVCAVCELVD